MALNRLNRRAFIGAAAAALTFVETRTAQGMRAVVGPVAPTGRPEGAVRHTFGWQGEHFLLDGKPFQILSGEMHYARVPRPYWRDRMRKMRAMGLNTLCAYMFWNVHEPQPGQFDFDGNLGAATFIRTAQEEGLWVILRPGPYSCAEWDFGGFPAWLLATPDMKVRSSDPRFLAAASKYLARAGRELAPLQITRGGPILMVQVENEYGSFGRDKVYLNAIRQMIRDAGFDVTLYTSDGSQPDMLAAGTLPDALSAINFGDGDDPAAEFANFAKFRQNVPRMCGEYWVGWFDHWGEKHHVRPPELSARGLEWMLSRGISVNLYMVHGGTSFGFMSGANYDRAYQPDISSYDYDSPLDEAGRPTKKFFALREVLQKHQPPNTQLPALPKPQPMVEIPRFELKESARLDGLLVNPIRSPRPQTMEAAGQSYGFILYRKTFDRAARGRLEIVEARDYVLVCRDGKRLGVLDRRLKQTSLEVELTAGQLLDILVENMGRINFGPQLVSDRKGITEKVTLNGQELTGWEIYPLPMVDLSRLAFSPAPKPAPALHRGAFELASPGDTFLDLRGWGKGCAWINGNNLGRYWSIGPQQSLFVPAAWMRPGRNEVLLLDLEDTYHRSLQGLKDPVWGSAKT